MIELENVSFSYKVNGSGGDREDMGRSMMACMTSI